MLDLDGSGTVDASELTAAVTLLNESRRTSKRLFKVILALIAFIVLLVLALFGTSYAAVVLATTIKASASSGTAALSNVAGVTLRTASATLPNAYFTPAGSEAGGGAGGRRMLSSDHPAEYFSHRRKIGFTAAPNGRQLAVAVDTNNSGVPPPLVLVATLGGGAAAAICQFAAENNYYVAVPFDPYQTGATSTVVAHFKASTMLGCGSLDTFGFASDFGVTFATGSDETFWHVDCPAPVSSASTCAVSRVFLVPQMPDLTQASTPDAPVFVPLPSNVTTAGSSRRLAPGVWPPPAISMSTASSDCPSLSSGTIPTVTGVDNSDSWKAAIMNQLPVDPTATPKQQAIQACETSMLCMAGYLIGSGQVFKASFWTSAAAMSVAMGTEIATSFRQTISPSNIRASFTNLGGRTNIKCTNYYSWATCGSPTSVVVFNGVTGSGSGASAQYSCKSWNVNDVRAGAIEIAATCANSCEMLEWYMSWYKNYRVGYYYTANGVPTWDSTSYNYYQDYCGTGNTQDWSSAKYGGQFNSPVFSDTRSYVTHPTCWSGGHIPLCQSFKILTYSTC